MSNEDLSLTELKQPATVQGKDADVSSHIEIVKLGEPYTPQQVKTLNDNKNKDKNVCKEDTGTVSMKTIETTQVNNREETPLKIPLTSKCNTAGYNDARSDNNTLEARTESNSTFGKILQNGTNREIQAESRKSSRTVKSKVDKDEIITSQKTRILNLEIDIKHMKTVIDSIKIQNSSREEPKQEMKRGDNHCHNNDYCSNMRDMLLEHRLRAMETQMMQNMCIQTAITTQIALQNRSNWTYPNPPWPPYPQGIPFPTQVQPTPHSLPSMIGHPFQFGQVNPPGQIPPINARTPQCGQVNPHMQIPTMNSHTPHFGQLNPLIQIPQIPVCSPSSTQYHPGYPIMSNGQGVQHQTFRPPGYGLSQTINMQNPNNHQLHRMPPPTMETAKKYCQPIPPTFVSFQPTEPCRAVPHDQQRSQGTFKPNENHEVQETYAEIHDPHQNGTETQPKVTKVDQEQEFQELNQSTHISSKEGQDQSSQQNHTACQENGKIVDKKHSDENQPHQNKQNSGNEKQQEKNVTMNTSLKTRREPDTERREYEYGSTSPFSASEPPKMAPRQQIERGKKQNDIEIVTCNIEGLKTNILFLQSLNPGNSIICLQEHFIWELKKKKLSFCYLLWTTLLDVLTQMIR